MKYVGFQPDFDLLSAVDGNSFIRRGHMNGRDFNVKYVETQKEDNE